MPDREVPPVGTEAPGADPPVGPGFETRAIHAGQPPDPATGAVVTPIFQTSTFAQPEVGAQQAFEYSRTGNPTRTALETCLADLEGTTYGAAFASGLAAEDAVLRCLEPGDHVIIGNELYGGTYRLLDQVHSLIGLEFTPVALHDADSIRAVWRPSTRMVWMETPSNPQLHVSDIASVAEIAHSRSALVVVDNTFATPYLQRPVVHGADIVVHSTTKYLSGHSDVVGGFVATSEEDVAERIAFLQNATGAVPGPRARGGWARQSSPPPPSVPSRGRGTTARRPVAERRPRAGLSRSRQWRRSARSRSPASPMWSRRRATASRRCPSPTAAAALRFREGRRASRRVVVVSLQLPTAAAPRAGSPG